MQNKSKMEYLSIKTDVLVVGGGGAAVLDEIFQKSDPSIGYYKHSGCYHGKCQRCSVRLNQKIVLACQTSVPNDGEIQLDPVSTKKLVRDLVIRT